MSFAPVVQVDSDACTACHRCIAACPVKFCNKAEDGAVAVNPDLCIGCGECIKVCTHGARIPVDDLEAALEALKNREPVAAIVAPAVAANFPETYENLNGWLKGKGCSAVFDVSFGAELTVKSYLEYIKAEKPDCVIAQPCPALVSFIEIFRPGLIPYLAPADSPMVHTMKMVQEFYPEYRDHRFLVISPCLAKRREFDETGFENAYNVTMHRLREYLEENQIDLRRYEPVDFDNDPAERAVLFSTPGGLMRTAAREVPELVSRTRKIEGPHSLYRYLAYLKEDIGQGKAPMLIDALNCEMGCNGGPGTDAQFERLDTVETRVETRRQKMQERYGIKKSRQAFGVSRGEKRRLHRVINRYWKPGLYHRSYQDRRSHFSDSVEIPGRERINELFGEMYKHEKEDILNCGSCGYGRCERMAIAIHNGLNTRENCIFFMEESVREERNQKGEVIDRLSGDVTRVSDTVKELTESMERFIAEVEDQHRVIAEVVEEVRDMVNRYGEVQETVTGSHQDVKDLDTITREGAEKLKKTNSLIRGVGESTDSMFDMLSMMNNIVSRTNLLSMNASIEAAHAGESGRGFAVVADEIRQLAESAFSSTDEISSSLKETIKQMEASQESSEKSGEAFGSISNGVQRVSGTFETVLDETRQISEKAQGILDSLSSLTDVSERVKNDSDGLRNYTSSIIDSLTDMLEK